MAWCPDLSFIEDVYHTLRLQYPSLKGHSLIKRESLIGIIDNLKFGLPISGITLNLFQRAARFLREVVTRSPYSDGNKRIGFIITFEFLKNNGFKLVASENEKIFFTKEIAMNTSINYMDLAKWLEDHSETIEF